MHAVHGSFFPARVPGKLQEKLGVLFARLEGAHVVHPDLADPFAVRLSQLRARLREGDAVDEKITQGRRRPIRGMEVQCVPAAAGALARGEIAADVPEVVVRPHHGHVIRKAQPRIV